MHALTFDLAVVSCTTTAATAAEMPALRTGLLARYPRTLTSSLVRQLDDQTVVALAALAEAAAAAERAGVDTRAWAVVAAPRRPGRGRIGDSIRRFRDQGAWSVSPHLIPHLSLHSLAGLVSQAGGLQAANIGAGGTPDRDADVLLAAASFLLGDGLPGAWAIWAGWGGDGTAPATTPDRCRSAVLGLVLSPAVGPGAGTIRVDLSGPCVDPPFLLDSLADALEADCAVERSWGLGDSGRAALRRFARWKGVAA